MINHVWLDRAYNLPESWQMIFSMNLFLYFACLYEHLLSLCFHGNQCIFYSKTSFRLIKGNDCFWYWNKFNIMEGNVVIMKLSWIKLIFWPLLRSGCSMDYHGNNYFIDVKISDFAAGRTDASYIIKLNHLLHKTLLFQANDSHIFHFK